MPTLSKERMEELLTPFIGEAAVPHDLYAQLMIYLDLIGKWSLRTNLTSIREPSEIVTRHFGESLFLGKHLPSARTLLDYGSGAGFPGLPIQLLLPDLAVTLAEAQGKKASFLQEVVRVLGLNTKIWPHRVEAMSAASTFDIVALRAVDKMDEAIEIAVGRLSHGGTLALLTSGTEDGIAIPGAFKRIVRFVR